MTEQHPITPSPELVHQWHKEACKDPYHGGTFFESKTLKHIATRAAQWGADAELESCCVELEKSVLNGAFYVGGESCPSWHSFARKAISKLRAARRPKPPSLKEQALQVLRPLSNPVMPGTPEYRLYEPQAEIIRRALEALPDD
jgi:hypothetical protein